MRVLGIDTATFTASAAVVESSDDGGGRVLAHGTLDTSTRGDDLLVLIDRVCREAAAAPRRLDAVAVGAGPGSFTGLRIGMATAKGIAFAAGCPLWISSSLAAMAAEAAAELGAAAALLVPVLDARRAEVFAGFYTADGDGHVTLAAAEQVFSPLHLEAAVTAAVAGRAMTVVYMGDALAAHASLAPLTAAWRSAARTPGAAWVARDALKGSRLDHLATGRTAYLRPPEAEVMYPHGVPGALRRDRPAEALVSADPLGQKTNSR
jgi:tRNA threonylcarbamoyladenosine biosynthesis protein TsaB